MKGSSVLEINLDTIAENANRVVVKCREKGIEVIGVTKGFSANHEIVRAMIAGGIDGLADARMENIMELRNRNFHNPFTLLRIPRLSNVNNVVRYTETSINSEITVMEALSAAATRIRKVHNIILMVDVGDLREGVLQENVLAMAVKIQKMHGVNLAGLGTNMGCYGGVLPSYENLDVLITLRDLLEQKLDHKLEVISGGGTSSLLLVETDGIPQGINQLRIGEGILLGTDTTNNRNIPWLLQDAFHLRAEVIEVKEKPSMPIGEIGRDAFGNIPHFDDVGILKRAIISLGKQDVYVEGICPVEEKYTILGASSDHIIVDITEAGTGIKVGDKMFFTLTYPGLLSASDSRYIEKEFKGGLRHGS
ncbi:MAG TPA: alanine/ornithine racemase family PLP-dependent enzyme [Patescibacteria group bacterium]|nr:alanine/ornithine racemase family PLP-dependent enzyme [Patescibacteria group bacterium]